MRSDVVDYGAFRIYSPCGEVTLVRDDKIEPARLRLMTDRAECPIVSWVGPMTFAVVLDAIHAAIAEGMTVHRVMFNPDDFDFLWAHEVRPMMKFSAKVTGVTYPPEADG